MSNPRPEISVIVCSFNGARTLDACLEALEHQTVRSKAQVILVDDGSTDSTNDIARRHDVELLVHDRNRGISAARNTGIAAARAPVIAFTDDDCIPDSRWLETLLAVHERPEVVGAGGPVDIARVDTLVHRYLAAHPPLAPLELELDTHRGLLARLELYVRSMWSTARRTEGRAVYSFPGANMSFKAEAIHAVGGFDPTMTFGSDDEYLCARVRDRFPDSILWLEPQALVRHDYEGTLRDVLRRNYAYGKGHARTYLTSADHRWPIVFPLPIAALIALYALRRSWRLVLVPLLLHLALPQGIAAASRSRRAGDLAFTWLRLAEEAAHNAGMVVGLATLAPRIKP
jgi:glycosyltransferase involved in cell wall biosynthesis